MKKIIAMICLLFCATAFAESDVDVYLINNTIFPLAVYENNTQLTVRGSGESDAFDMTMIRNHCTAQPICTVQLFILKGNKSELATMQINTDSGSILSVTQFMDEYYYMSWGGNQDGSLYIQVQPQQK